jgi:hypothetical protein
MGLPVKKRKKERNAPNRATRSISLVLIGSSLLLPGCSRPRDTREDTSTEQEQPGGGSGGITHHHGGSFIPVGGTRVLSRPASGSGTGTRTSVGGTTRGGFGSIGHAAAGG